MDSDQPQPLHKDLVKRYQEVTADHHHAVMLIQEKNQEISRLRSLNAQSNRQNRRLSRECRQLANRLKELNPEDSIMIDLLFAR